MFTEKNENFVEKPVNLNKLEDIWLTKMHFPLLNPREILLKKTELNINKNFESLCKQSNNNNSSNCDQV